MWQDCMGTLQAAEAGEVRLVVSALAIAEVLMLKGHPVIPSERSQMVRDFFRKSWISVRQVDRTIAELAQDFVWDHEISPKDAIHVATAIHLGVPFLDTFDGPLIQRGVAFKERGLLIDKPSLAYQGTLDLA